MKRFLEWFYERKTTELVNRINEYAEKHNLQIISVTTDEILHAAVVLFEGTKPKHKW